MCCRTTSSEWVGVDWRADDRWTIATLADTSFFPDKKGELARLADRWLDHLTAGRFKLSIPSSTPLGADVGAANFWTTQYAYQDLPAMDPALLAELQKAGLVLFKGDLK